MIQPQVRNIVRVVGQPSFIEAYERTSIFAKPSAFIEKWIVDIGDKVKKDEVLATLFVPELVEDHQTKGATVELDRERIALAKEVVEVAAADVKAADGAAQGGQRHPGEVRGRGRALGRRRSSGSSARSTRAWSTRGSSRSRTISSSRASRRGTSPRRPSSGPTPSCSPGGPRWPRPRSTSRSPRPT